MENNNYSKLEVNKNSNCVEYKYATKHLNEDLVLESPLAEYQFKITKTIKNFKESYLTINESNIDLYYGENKHSLQNDIRLFIYKLITYYDYGTLNRITEQKKITKTYKTKGFFKKTHIYDLCSVDFDLIIYGKVFHIAETYSPHINEYDFKYENIELFNYLSEFVVSDSKSTSLEFSFMIQNN